jgi:small redox-active disulfide protein 2
MNVKVLGTGCARCKQLYAEAQKALAQSGVEASLEKVEKIDEIMKFGVMMTPALVIDTEVKCSGRIPQAAEIVSWLTTAAAKAG